MRKIICKILGIRDLKPQLQDLQKTVDSMQSQLDQMFNTYNQCLQITEWWKRSDKSAPWYEDDRLLMEMDHESRSLAYNIQSDNKRKIVYTHPALKRRGEFHGGCMGCITPLKESIGSCKGCFYFNRLNNSFPDLSKKYQNENPE